jgi:hypothetical protein
MYRAPDVPATIIFTLLKILVYLKPLFSFYDTDGIPLGVKVMATVVEILKHFTNPHPGVEIYFEGSTREPAPSAPPTGNSIKTPASTSSARTAAMTLPKTTGGCAASHRHPTRSASRPAFLHSDKGQRRGVAEFRRHRRDQNHYQFWDTHPLTPVDYYRLKIINSLFPKPASGHYVRTQSLQSNGSPITTSIDLTGLAPGMYFIKAGGETLTLFVDRRK